MSLDEQTLGLLEKIDSGVGNLLTRVEKVEQDQKGVKETHHALEMALQKWNLKYAKGEPLYGHQPLSDSVAARDASRRGGRAVLAFAHYPAETREAVLGAFGAWFRALRNRDDERMALAAERIAEVTNTKADMQEGTDAEGGYMVPTIVQAEIARLAELAGSVRSVARVVPMASKSHTVPTLANAFSVGVVAEETALGDATPASPFGSATLTAKKVGGLVTVSEELLQDSVVDLGRFVLEILTEAVLKTEDLEALEGDGTNFTGLFSVSGINSEAVSAALTNLDPFVSAVRKVQQQSVLAAANGVWFVSPLLWDVIQKLKVAEFSGDTNGAYRVNQTLLDATKPTLLGYPVFLSNQISDSRGTGTNESTAYFGDFSRLYVGDRFGLSLMIDPYTKMAEAQVRMRVMERVGIAVAVPAAFCKVTGIQVS